MQEKMSFQLVEKESVSYRRLLQISHQKVDIQLAYLNCLSVNATEKELHELSINILGLDQNIQQQRQFKSKLQQFRRQEEEWRQKHKEKERRYRQLLRDKENLNRQERQRRAQQYQEEDRQRAIQRLSKFNPGRVKATAVKKPSQQLLESHKKQVFFKPFWVSLKQLFSCLQPRNTIEKSQSKLRKETKSSVGQYSQQQLEPLVTSIQANQKTGKEDRKQSLKENSGSGKQYPKGCNPGGKQVKHD